MGQLCSRSYEPLEKDDAEAGKPTDIPTPPNAPEQWQPIEKLKGSGQCEFQGFDTWTPEEKQAYIDGTLKKKWAFGQVSIRLPLPGPVSFIAIVYGYLPFVIPLWWLLWLIGSWVELGKPQFFPTCGLAIAAGFALVNETITKQICKRTLPASITNRPPEAVCNHPGMPSGHVMNAYTLMTWCLLECALDKIVHIDWLIAIAVVMAPVPWARVYNKDHTVPQVMVSFVVAIIMGSIAYYVRKSYFPHHEQPWDVFYMNSMEIPTEIAKK